MWYTSSINPYITETQLSLENDIISNRSIKKVIDYYTLNLSEIKNNTIGRQLFYSKPIIRMQDNKNLCINIFLILFLFENSTYWLTRNYYLEKGTQDFTNAFGIYFEIYAEELFATYLLSDNFHRMPEGRTEKADWELKIDKYRILIEQKAALAGLKAKQQNSDIEATKTYIIRNWLKAINQLSFTQKDYNGECHIKIVLTYDNYYQAECLDLAFALSECQVEDDGYYWLVSINELEMLLYTYKNDVALFKKIIDEKISRETIKSHDGRSLNMIMGQFGIEHNEHIKSMKFYTYFQEIQNIFNL